MLVIVIGSIVLFSLVVAAPFVIFGWVIIIGALLAAVGAGGA